MTRSVLAALLLLALAAQAPSPRAYGAQTWTVTVGTDDVDAPPEGSLRDIVENRAQAGDTIVFAGAFAIELKGNLFLRDSVEQLTLRGPAELRVSVPDRGRIRSFQLAIQGDDITVDNLTFTNVDLVAFTGSTVESVTRPRVLNCRFFGNYELDFLWCDDGEMADCVLEFRSRFKRGLAAIETSHCRGFRVGKNKLVSSDDDFFAYFDVASTGLVVEDNEFGADVILFPNEGVLSGNKAPSQIISVGHSTFEGEAHFVVRDNECGSLYVSRLDTDVIDNTVDATAVDPAPSSRDGKPRKFPKESALVVLAEGTADDTGPMLVTGNVVTGGRTGFLYAEVSTVTTAEVSRNVVTGATRKGMIVNAQSDLIVSDNTVRDTGTSRSAIGIQVIRAGERMRLVGNVVEDSAGLGISVLPGTGRVEILAGAVRGSGSTGIQIGAKRPFSLDGCAVEGNAGRGVAVLQGARGTISAGSIRDNGGAGVLLFAKSTVLVDAVSFGGNGGPGIDLYLEGVTPNNKTKKANGDLDWPADLDFDDATGKVTGKTVPFAIVQGYAVEDGPRTGNPRNGEGSVFLGEVQAIADGSFTWPESGRAPCPASGKLTFTASVLAPGAPRTSEFSEDVECSAGGVTERMSVSSAGAQGNDESRLSDAGTPNRVVSADGRFVVFPSRASNLVPSDTNARRDVFVRDRQAGTTQRVSLTSAGGQIDPLDPDFNELGSYDPAISADGRYVCFESDGDGIVANDDVNVDRHVYVRDLVAGTTVAVSDPTLHEPPLPSGAPRHSAGHDPSISGNGRFVAFVTQDEDWDPRDDNANDDVFVWDRTSGAVEMVSLTTGGQPFGLIGFSGAATPRLSADGRHVAFTTAQDLTGATGVAEKVFVRDRQAGTTTLVSVSGAGLAARGFQPSISDDGTRVAFVCPEPLVAADTNGTSDVYLRDLVAGTTTLVSRDRQEMIFLDDATWPSLSGDGRKVAFAGPGGHVFPSGAEALFRDIFVRDLEAGTTTEGSVGATGDADNISQAPALSTDGRFLAWASTATNLVEGDTNALFDVFLRDRSGD